MKKRAGIFIRMIMAVFAVTLLFLGGEADVKAASSEQAKNMVIVYGVSQGTTEVALNGFLIARDKGGPVVVSAATDSWDEMDEYYMVGPDVEEQKIKLLKNDDNSRVAVFETNLNEGGCETSDMASYSEVAANYSWAYASGLDKNGSAANGDDWEKSELVLVSSETTESNGYYYLEIIPDVSNELGGGPMLLDDERVAGILVAQGDNCAYTISMDDVINLIPEGSGFSGWRSINGTTFFMALIPLFAVVFIVSSILYVNKQKKIRQSGQEEFANVLVLGGESGLQLLGKGGTFDEAKLPLEEKIIFGRDVSRCFAIYPPDAKKVSRVHCSVEIKDGKVVVTDLGSSYGTYLENGEKLEENKPYYLNYGDSFYLAEPENTFKIV